MIKRLLVLLALTLLPQLASAQVVSQGTPAATTDVDSWPIKVTFGDAQIDPRAIRTLTIGDQVTAILGASTSIIGHVVVDSAPTTAITVASLPLPALAATSTKQSDGTQKTQVVDGSGNVISATANALNTSTATAQITGSATFTTSGQTRVIQTNNSGVMSFQVSGIFSGNIFVEGSVDGVTWSGATLNLVNALTGLSEGSLSVATNVYIADAAPFAAVRLETFSFSPLGASSTVSWIIKPGLETDYGAIRSVSSVPQATGIYNSVQPTAPFSTSPIAVQSTLRGAQIVATGVDVFNVAVNAALPAGTNVIGHVINDASSAVIGHVIADTGSTTAVTGNVTAVQATGSNLHVAVDSAPTTAVTGTFFQATQPVSGTVTTTPPANASTNVAQFAGSNALTGTGTGGAGVPRVTVSNDSTVGLVAGTAVIGHVIADSGSTTAVTGNVTAVQATAASLNMTEASAAAIKTDVDKIPSLGQALAAASVPVVLPVAQITTLTPPAAITGFALDSSLTTLDTDVKANVTLHAGTNVIGHVINDASAAVIGHVVADTGSTTAVTGNVTAVQATGSNLHVVVDTAPSTAVTNAGTFAVQAAATLAAETTKVIGTVNVAAAQTIATTNAGTFAVQAAATLAAETTKVIGTVNDAPPTLTKATQGSTGFSTQDLKDAGRTLVTLTAERVIPILTTDTIVTFSKLVGDTVTAAQTTYAVTSGKTLRLQYMTISLTPSSTTLGLVQVRLRTLSSGACIVSTGLRVAGWEVGNQGTATQVANAANQREDIVFPDGMEFSGATRNICLSMNALGAAAQTVTISLVGYEY